LDGGWRVITHADARATVRVDAQADPHVANVATLKVDVDASRYKSPVYITALCVSEDRSIHRIWPGRSATDNKLSPGSPRTFPTLVSVTLAPDGSRVLKDRILVIATDRQADYSALVRTDGSLLPAVQEPARMRDGHGNGLPAVLEEALAPATRGVRNVLGD